MLKNKQICDLRTSIIIQGREYAIRHDFRPCVDIMVMFEDVDLTEVEKMDAMLIMLYEEQPPICEEAYLEAVIFLNGGDRMGIEQKSRTPDVGRLYSWEQDYQHIFSAIDRVLGFSSRRSEYLHWWEFMGAFMEIGECLFSTMIHLRKGKKQGKLTKEERTYWNENIDVLELKIKATTEEQRKIDYFNNLARGEKP